MPSDVAIINLGIGKYSATRVRRIDPGSTSLESFCGEGYPQWRASELTKRRWVFATVFDYLLTASENDPTRERPYKFLLPNDCLRPIREKGTTWVQSGRALYAYEAELKLDYVRNVDEAEFDPLFIDVLAARCGIETVNHVTESRPKKVDLTFEYDRAVSEAAKQNAFVIGPENVNGDDSAYPFLEARWA